MAVARPANTPDLCSFLIFNFSRYHPISKWLESNWCFMCRGTWQPDNPTQAPYVPCVHFGRHIFLLELGFQVHYYNQSSCLFHMLWLKKKKKKKKLLHFSKCVLSLPWLEQYNCKGKLFVLTNSIPTYCDLGIFFWAVCSLGGKLPCAVHWQLEWIKATECGL